MTIQITPEQIKSQLTGIFRSVFEDPTLTLTDEMTADDVDGWDSLSHITLVISVERAFHIKLTLAEIQRLDDVGALIQLIQSKVPVA